MARVAQLRRVHREAPARISGVEEERVRLQNVGARKTVLRLADEIAVDDDLDRRHAVLLVGRPALERHVASHVVEGRRNVDESLDCSNAVLGAFEKDRDTLRSRQLRERLLLIADANLQNVLSGTYAE